MLSSRLVQNSGLHRALQLPVKAIRPRINNLYGPASIANMTTISDVIKHDHQELDEYYNNILSAKDDDEKVRWQNQFTWELTRHSIGEELVVYPAMEKHLTNGKELADKDRSEHRTVR